MKIRHSGMLRVSSERNLLLMGYAYRSNELRGTTVPFPGQGRPGSLKGQGKMSKVTFLTALATWAAIGAGFTGVADA